MILTFYVIIFMSSSNFFWLYLIILTFYQKNVTLTIIMSFNLIIVSQFLLFYLIYLALFNNSDILKCISFGLN